MSLNIKKRLEEIKANYEAGYTEDKANFLIIGRMGSGKSCLIPTCPGPVLVHSFDPGGTKSILPAIRSGKVLADTRFEKENARNPSAYKLWEDEFNNLSREGVFNEIGTYVLDSATKWFDALMNSILKSKSRAATAPQQADYGAQQIFAVAAMQDITNLPCHTMVIGHIDVDAADPEGKSFYSMLCPGKSKTKIPLMFDEFYRLEAIAASKGVERKLLTEIDGRFEARTRIGAGKLDKREEPNITNILKKCGYPYQDKEISE